MGGTVTPPATYRVVLHDTLSGIARRFGTSVQVLARLNNIRDVDRIRVGLLLRLPGASPQSVLGQRSYIVRPGDTLSELAERFGTSVSRLASLNGIRDPDRIPAGMALRLPGPAPTGPAPARPAARRPPSAPLGGRRPPSAGTKPAVVVGPVPPPKGGVTARQLAAIMPTLPRVKAALYLPYLNAAMAEGAITTPLRMAAFLAQLAHESVQLRYFEEIASGAAYEGRTSLGNTHPGDGKRFKGRGPIQLTGRANYTAASKALKVDLVGHPTLAATPAYGFRIAAWFWTSRGLNALADRRHFDAITLRVNGGLRGKRSRDAYYARAKSVLGV